MRIHRLLFCTPLFFLLTGCYSYMTVRPGTLRPATAHIQPERRVEVWQRAITALLDAGYVPELLNETACFIRARQREDLVPDATNRTSAVVTVGTDGLLRVEVAGAGFYSNADALATDLAQKQGALMHGILLLVDPPASPHTP